MDVIGIEGIRHHLDEAYQEYPVTVLEETASTNALAREEAALGAPEGSLFIAKRQTAGRGRLGRSFFSPGESGLYFSLILRPYKHDWNGLSDGSFLTTMAAVAMCEAIEAVLSIETGIKWVNDIFYEGKKVGGILTEGSIKSDGSGFAFVILGIGINVYAPEGGFPRELSSIAGSLLPIEMEDAKNRLLADFLNRFFHAYHTWQATRSADTVPMHIEAYRKRSIVLNQCVTVHRGVSNRPACVLGIGDDCSLLVEYEDGTRESIFTGEVSIRFLP